MAEWICAERSASQLKGISRRNITTVKGRTMVVNRGDIKRKRKDDSCFSMLDESPKRTKVHAQRKFAQGSNVSSPVITPVKEIERQERNRDVLPEPIELLPMKRPNTEDFLTFLCFRGTPILPPNLNFFNAASMMDSSLRNSEPKTTYPKNGPILTSSPSKCQNEKPFVAFGVRKRADPIVISKQMDRKRRHALALQALRRKYQEQKMAKIRAVTISKLSEKVTNKNVVRTRSVTKNEIASKKSIMHKTNIKVISTKRITTKTAINKQPVKSKMCLRSFRGRYIHRELNIKTHRKRGPQQRVPPPKLVEKSSSEFSSDDDEPLMKSVKEKPPKKQAATAQKLKKTIENTIRLTRSHNKLLQKVQSQQRKQTLKHRRIITRLSSTMTPSNQRIKSKIVQSSSNIIRNLRKSVNNIKRSGNQNLTQVIRSTRQRIVKNTTEKSVQTRSKSDRTIKEKEEPPKKIEANLPSKKNTGNIEKIVKKNEKTKIEIKTKIVKKKEIIKSPPLPPAPPPSKKIEKPPASIKSGDDKINKPKPLGEKSKPPPSNEKNVKVKTKEAEQSPGPSPGKRKVDTIKKAMQKIGNSRPSRKTKEAAAIYMELLGHKLVNDTEVDDDDESIDSFPELPNVRRTEQRENELKAKAKSKDVKEDVKDALPVKKVDKIESAKAGDKMEVKDPMPAKKAPIQEQKCQKSTSPTEKINVVPSSDVEVSPAKIEESKDVKEVDSIGDSLKTPVKTVKRQLSVTESDIDKAMALMLQRNSVIIYNDSESPESLKKSEEPKSRSENSPAMIKKKSPDLDESFSDSDEEPLSNLTKSKDKTINVRETPTIDTTNEQQQQQQQPKMVEKSKRDCTKKVGHNYLPFSSSDDEEKYFHGFKTELKSSKIGGKPDSVEKCPQHSSLPSSDLSCKDVSRRFGKGKVNMSNEQIEKWLNDSAMAGMTIKKEEDDILKYEEEKLEPLTKLDPTPPPLISSPENMIKTEDKNLISGKSAANRENDESLSLNSSTPEKNTIQATPTPPKITPTSERKTIFKKERSEPVRNVNAFSASNECSVYAFEADTEDSTSISTPFRRPCRRPSSTATSRSEDDAKIIDDISKHSTGKFRFPAVLRGDYKILNRQDSATGQPIQEDSTTQSTNLDVHTFTDTSNSEPPSIIEDISDQQIFCASTSSSTGQQQPNKNQSPPDIACAKVILGKTLPTGGNLHKTHSKLKAMHQQKKTMFPPAMLHKGKNDDVRYKVPSSPSASSSSSAKLVNKRQTGKTRNRLPEAAYTQVVNVAEFPNPQAQQVRHQAQIVEAPCFHPTEKEFQDPLDYIEKIRARAEKFGICRIIPPANFKPECKVSDDMRFTAYNQYVNKLLHRWGPNFKELMAIRKYLETQKITLTHPPWIGGMEIDLPRLYQTVQSLGGLKEVIEKKKWSKVSEAMKIPKSAQDRVTKLDDIYCKYLLPYDTLSPAEREKLFDEVETEWAKRESKTLLKVQRLSSGTDGDSDSDNESEECIVKGRNVALNAFYRIARNTMSMWFKTIEPSAEEVEQEFWKHVTLKNNHICVHSGSIDSGNWGYGFAVSKNSPFARHAWNLKVLTNNSGSVLRSMGPVMGVTVPTLHVGMVFSACCWYRDPHRLPWIEYLHTGAHKIWYGIPDSMSERFHASMLKLVPNYCRNKSIWLPSDTVMVPPKLLVENGVSLCRTVQEPGQFVVVFPKVFTSSVSTGYVVSESVYFAPSYWLKSAQNVFDELRKNCEPSMFSVDRLLLSITSDTRSSLQVLKQVMPAVQELCDREKRLREKLRELGLKLTEKLPPPEVPAVRKRRKLQQRQDNNGGDYECEICRANLFISLVNEYQEDVIYCLEHVIEYIEQKKIDVKNCKLLFTYGCEELDLLLEKLRNTIEAKQQKKAVTKAGPSTMQ